METYYHESPNIMELVSIMEPSIMGNNYYESPNIMERETIVGPNTIIKRYGPNHYMWHSTLASLATKLGKPVWRGK